MRGKWQMDPDQVPHTGVLNFLYTTTKPTTFANHTYRRELLRDAACSDALDSPWRAVTYSDSSSVPKRHAEGTDSSAAGVASEFKPKTKASKSKSTKSKSKSK